MAGSPPKALAGDLFVRSRASAAAPSTDAADADGGPDGRAWAARRAAIREFLDGFAVLEASLAGRMRLLRFLLDVSRLPAEKREPAIARLRPPQVPLARSVLSRLPTDQTLARALGMATTRWDDVAATARALGERLARLDEAAAVPSEALAALADVDPARLRAKLYGLTTFDLLFREDPVLGQMFPQVAREIRRHGRPSEAAPSPHGASTRPTVAPPRPAATLATPPPERPLARVEGWLRQLLADTEAARDP